MTREDFFKIAGPHFTYMFNESKKKAWEGILPVDGIKAFYRSDCKQNEDRTFTETYLFLTDKRLIEVSVSANQISSESHRFEPFNIYKAYTINDFTTHTPEIAEVKIQFQRNKPGKILKKPSDIEDAVDYRNFIQCLI
jgi:hypothetical protein